MFMSRLVLYVGVVLCAFTTGISVDRLLKSPSRPTVAVVETNQKERPLTREIVSRSLQSHSFSTDRLRKNSNNEIVWRWLKESIASFPQNWVKLTITDSESYHVTFDPLTVLNRSELDYLNEELEKKGLPALEQGKRYQPITVHQGDILCPSWSGLIDVEEAKLVYFAGSSA